MKQPIHWMGIWIIVYEVGVTARTCMLTGSRLLSPPNAYPYHMMPLTEETASGNH